MRGDFFVYQDVYPSLHVRTHFLRDGSHFMVPVSSSRCSIEQIGTHSLFSRLYNSPWYIHDAISQPWIYVLAACSPSTLNLFLHWPHCFVRSFVSYGSFVYPGSHCVAMHSPHELDALFHSWVPMPCSTTHSRSSSTHALDAI